MAEQAIAGAVPEPQTDARLLEGKQQVRLIPGLEASTSTQTYQDLPALLASVCLPHQFPLSPSKEPLLVQPAMNLVMSQPLHSCHLQLVMRLQ